MFLYEGKGVIGCYGFDLLDFGVDFIFGNNFEEVDFVGVFDVVFIIEFGVEIINFNDVYFVIVFVGEEGDCFYFFSGINVGFDCCDWNFFLDLFVDYVFNFFKVFFSNLIEVVEVKV